MAVIEVKKSSFKDYPGGEVACAIQKGEWTTPAGTYVPNIPEEAPYIIRRLYIGAQGTDGTKGFFEQSYPWKKPSQGLRPELDYTETLIANGIPLAQAYNKQPEAVLWTPKRKEITVVQFPLSEMTEGQVIQVASAEPPPLDHSVLANGRELVGTLEDLGFERNDFSFLAGGTPLSRMTGVSGVFGLGHILPKRIEEKMKKLAAPLDDVITNKIPPREMGELKYLFRATRRPISSMRALGK